MNDIKNMLEVLEDTHDKEVLLKVQSGYENIDVVQAEWYKKSKFLCPQGCGSCCHNFEPDLLESEALYMAAWLIENQKDVADKVLEGKYPFDNGDTCGFHDFSKDYHCSIYGGRPSICRLFGASGSKAKNGETVWKPCKFYPIEMLEKHVPPLAHRQYSSKETEEIFGTLPPKMYVLMEEILNASDSKQTEPLKQALPKAIAKLYWLMKIKSM